MRTKTPVAIVFCLFGAATPMVVAQSFIGLGDLPGGDFRSSANDLSADGKFVTGSSSGATGNEAFLWSEETGMVGLGVPLGGSSSNGNAITGDGAKVVGTYLDGSAIDPRRTFEWTSASGLVDFDPFPMGIASPNATGVSASGDAIVGFYRPTPSVDFVAFHSSAGTLTNIAAGFAGAVSADGTVVVGTTDMQAFRWTAVDGVTELGYLPGGTERSTANGISADGQVIVGSSRSVNAPLSQEAFRWTSTTGMVGLGALPGGEFASSARDTTADGGIVVGTSGDSLFIWDKANGMRDLVKVMTNDYGLGDALAGWNLSSISAISDQGTVIVGFGTNPSGHVEAWRAVLVPEPSTRLLGTFTCLAMSLLRNRRART